MDKLNEERKIEMEYLAQLLNWSKTLFIMSQFNFTQISKSKKSGGFSGQGRPLIVSSK